MEKEKGLDLYTFLVYIQIMGIRPRQYSVVFAGKVRKSLRKLPQNVLQRFFMLAEQLKAQGPVAANWQNYGKLGENRYHCHLTYSWVACWRHEKGTIIIEVYYVGSRENAPY